VLLDDSDSDSDPDFLLLILTHASMHAQVVTNGVLKSIEHRVMTNLGVARTTVATFIMPTTDCLIGPAAEFLSDDNPPAYRTMTFGEFKRIYSVVKLGSSLNLTTNLKDVQKEL